MCTCSTLVEFQMCNHTNTHAFDTVSLYFSLFIRSFLISQWFDAIFLFLLAFDICVHLTHFASINRMNRCDRRSSAEANFQKKKHYFSSFLLPTAIVNKWKKLYGTWLLSIHLKFSCHIDRYLWIASTQLTFHYIVEQHSVRTLHIEPYIFPFVRRVFIF